MISRIHVNGHLLRMNKKDGGNRPVFTVKDYKGNRKGNLVKIMGPSTLEFDMSKKLKSGAVAYITTDAEVEVYD
jgi:hypothetical protein